MWRRSCLLMIIGCIYVVPATLGAIRWWADRALGQLTPVGSVRWEGYVIAHDPIFDDGAETHHVHVHHGDRLVWDESYYVGPANLFDEGPTGFFGGLDVDNDPELELVHCDQGVVESFTEPARSTNSVVRWPGNSAAGHAHELCALVERTGSILDLVCLACGCSPIVLPLFIVFAILARGERRKEEETGRVTF